MLPPRLPLTARPARQRGPRVLPAQARRLNSLDGDDLWKRVTVPAGGSRRLPDAAAVAALTGRAPAAPGRRAPRAARSRARPGVAAARPPARLPPLRRPPTPAGRSYRLLPRHEYACARHRYWIGPPDINQPGPELPGLPEIITAQRRHLQLVRQHGWEAVHDAILSGFMICGHLWTWQLHGTPGKRPLWERRGQALIPPGQAGAQFSASRVFAAVYPEAVSLAAVLASPRWRARPPGPAANSARSPTSSAASSASPPPASPPRHRTCREQAPATAPAPGQPLRPRTSPAACPARSEPSTRKARPSMTAPRRDSNGTATPAASSSATAPSSPCAYAKIGPHRLHHRRELAEPGTETLKTAELTRTTSRQTIRASLSSRRSQARLAEALNRNGHTLSFPVERGHRNFRVRGHCFPGQQPYRRSRPVDG